LRGFVSAIFCSLTLVIVGSAQTAPATTKKATTPATNSTSTVAKKASAAADTSKTAITIDGVCPAGTPGGKGLAPTCKTTISEAQMDRLIGALNPSMTGPVKQNLGHSLGEWTAYAAKARELGLDKGADFEEILHFARVQLLAQMLAKKVQKDAESVSPTQLQSYYDSHKNELEDFNFIRVIVPRQAASKDKPVDEAAEKQYAQEIRERLVKGEDAKALQTEAFKHSAQSAAEPTVELSGRKRGSLPPSQASIFELKPGEVSTVLPDPSAFFIYKLVSHNLPALDKAGPEIKAALVKQRLQEAMEDVQSKFKVKLEESYFGPEQQGPPMGAPSMRGPKGGAVRTPPPPGQGAAPQSQTPFQGKVVQLTPEQVKEVQKKLDDIAKTNGAAPQSAPPTSTAPATAPPTTAVPK
jgi:PPIC-type PPIASE domain